MVSRSITLVREDIENEVKEYERLEDEPGPNGEKVHPHRTFRWLWDAMIRSIRRKRKDFNSAANTKMLDHAIANHSRISAPARNPKQRGRSPTGRPAGRTPSRGSTRSPSQRKPKKDIPCKYHAKGMCKKGDACEWSHTARPRSSTPKGKGKGRSKSPRGVLAPGA